MKRYLFTLAASILAGFLPGAILPAEEPKFEGIDVLKTDLEAWGGLVNRGDGYFYGAARWAARMNGGAIFRIAPRQNAEILHTFPVIKMNPEVNEGGTAPSCGLIVGPDGALYGATEWGGANTNGTIYRITADGTYSVLYEPLRSAGQQINALTFAPNGDLYGTTRWGGTYGGGTLFRLRTDGVFEILREFGEAASDDGVPRLASPVSLHTGSDGNIYGTTTYSAIPGSFGPGALYRYDDPGQITILTEFYELGGRVQSCAAVQDGFYATTDYRLLHITFDGTINVIHDFDPQELINSIPTPLLPMPDGIYGVAAYYGANGAGYAYRYVPGEGTSIIYDFPFEYHHQFRCLAGGNDGLVYGLVTPPQGYTPLSSSGLTATARATVTAQAATGAKAKPKTFRFRQPAQSANFVPVAQADSAWLPGNAAAGKRTVTIDVLANDRDPDKNVLQLRSVIPPESGYAELISTAGKLRVRYVATNADPVSQWLHYKIEDGKGGSAIGDIAVRSLALGKYIGTAIDSTVPPASPATLTVNVTGRNIINATFIQGKVRYLGKSVLEVDETAAVVLTANGKPSLNLRLSLERGGPRKITATIVGAGSHYTAVCPQAAK